MKVFISDDPAPACWAETAALSATGAGLTVHRGGSSPQLRGVQRAGRQIRRLEVPGLVLSGSGWDVESQWALAQGYADPKATGGVEWAGGSPADRHTLELRRQAVDWVRSITNTTPEVLSPMTLARQSGEFISAVAPSAVSYRIVSGDELLEEGLVGIHGVGRGSDRPPALLDLDYNPDGGADAPLAAALVGKGITFDSGGYSMKSTLAMLPMKGDMGGAAMVTGALALAIGAGLQRRVRLLLCCAENLVSGHAYKLGDILQYRNGVRVEVVNTDAEGRLVLADGLVLATDSGAPLVLDAATLTGAAHTAVGSEYNAVFALDGALRERVLEYARQEHEYHWPLPLEIWHQQQCPSAYADTANSRPVPGGGPGGASNAAGFLSRFAPKGGKGWVHIDLAAAFRDRADDYWAAGATAMGIRTIARILLEEAR